MPVPEPIAPRKSAMTDKPPMHSPPKAAAVGMYLESETEGKKKIAMCSYRSVFSHTLQMRQPYK